MIKKCFLFVISMVILVLILSSFAKENLNSMETEAVSKVSNRKTPSLLSIKDLCELTMGD